MEENKIQKKAIKYGYCSLFAEKPTTQEAYDYAMDIIQSLEMENRIAALTAFQVFVNTVALERAKQETE